ncbi:MAG: response regulator [Rhodothermales bacterium]
MRYAPPQTPQHILLIEDDPGDVVLMREALGIAGLSAQMDVVHDGEAGLDYLHQRGTYSDRPRPDLIILDLNLPLLKGDQVLHHIKTDPNLKLIPVVIMSSSAVQDDILASYEELANSYILKPSRFEDLVDIARSLKAFWFEVVRLPPRD